MNTVIKWKDTLTLSLPSPSKSQYFSAKHVLFIYLLIIAFVIYLKNYFQRFLNVKYH